MLSLTDRAVLTLPGQVLYAPCCPVSAMQGPQVPRASVLCGLGLGSLPWVTRMVLPSVASMGRDVMSLLDFSRVSGPPLVPETHQLSRLWQLPPTTSAFRESAEWVPVRGAHTPLRTWPTAALLLLSPLRDPHP